MAFLPSDHENKYIIKIRGWHCKELFSFPFTLSQSGLKTGKEIGGSREGTVKRTQCKCGNVVSTWHGGTYRLIAKCNIVLTGTIKQVFGSRSVGTCNR